VWIRPEYAGDLAALEKGMRETNWGAPASAPSYRRAWTLESLEQALLGCPGVQMGHIGLEHLEGAEPALRLTMHEYGDLKLLLAVNGEQVLVEAYLWPQSSVIDANVFNEYVLETHKFLPLSTVSLAEVAGEPGYTLFCSLNTQASLSSVLFEIQTLAENVLISAEMYASHLVPTEAQ